MSFRELVTVRVSLEDSSLERVCKAGDDTLNRHEQQILEISRRSLRAWKNSFK
jgi:hypothetical protein